MASEIVNEGTSGVHEQEPRLKGWSWIWKHIFKCPVAVVWTILLNMVLMCIFQLAMYGFCLGCFAGCGHYMLCYAAVLNPLEKKIMQEYRYTGLAINAIITERFTIEGESGHNVVTINYYTVQYDSPDGLSKYQLCYSPGGSYNVDDYQVELLVLPDHMASGYPTLKINPDSIRFSTKERFWYFVGGFVVIAIYVLCFSFLLNGWTRFFFLAVYVGTIPVAVPVLSRRLRHKYNNYAVLVADDTPQRAGGEIHRKGSHWPVRLYIECVYSIERVLCPCLKARLCCYGKSLGPPFDEELSEGGSTRLSVIPV